MNTNAEAESVKLPVETFNTVGASTFPGRDLRPEDVPKEKCA
jgi:hypothetical protein